MKIKFGANIKGTFKKTLTDKELENKIAKQYSIIERKVKKEQQKIENEDFLRRTSYCSCVEILKLIGILENYKQELVEEVIEPAMGLDSFSRWANKAGKLSEKIVEDQNTLLSESWDKECFLMVLRKKGEKGLEDIECEN